MIELFWSTVDTYTDSRWWFGAPALVAFATALVLLVLAALRLHRRNRLSILLTTLALSVALVLLLPGALLSWQPLRFLGLELETLAQQPSATFPAVAQLLDRTIQLGYIGSGALLLAALGVMGGFGAQRGRPCPNCGRERHPTWGETCPECRLMEPDVAESPLMHQGDLSASGVPITQFGGPAQTELLDGSGQESAWVEVIQGPSGVGERFAVGARLTIGRDPGECQLVLDDESVSARHAYIEHDRQTLILYDWGSRNGTYVNDELIAQRVLHSGDTLQVGRVVLRFITTAPSADSAPTLLVDAESARARLIALNGPIDGEVFPLTQLDMRIGRGKQNDIVLDAPTVSRHHASIRFDGVEYVLLDAGAPNGTWLEGHRVLTSTVIRSGQILRLGAQRLRFEREEAPNGSTS